MVQNDILGAQHAHSDDGLRMNGPLEPLPVLRPRILCQCRDLHAVLVLMCASIEKETR